jgi:hypothetical protein
MVFLMILAVTLAQDSGHKNIRYRGENRKLTKAGKKEKSPKTRRTAGKKDGKNGKKEKSPKTRRTE